MNAIIEITNGELCKQLPIELIVEMTQHGWKTFSCKRRINEYCDKNGWDMLEEGVQAAHSLHNECVYKQIFQIDVARYVRLKELLPWIVNIIYYGVTGTK